MVDILSGSYVWEIIPRETKRIHFLAFLEVPHKEFAHAEPHEDVRQKLIKLYVVGRMGTLHLSIKRWRPRSVVDMADSQILYMPMKLGLKLMTIVCPNGMDPEREFWYFMVDETDRILLGMPGTDLAGSDRGRIIHGGILKTANLLPFSSHEIEKFHINLDLMTWNLFLISFG
jgi:hypothetical protein